MLTPIKEKVLNEGAEIYCECRGNGPILLLIHGAMGDAGYYSSAAAILADKFTVVSYDMIGDVILAALGIEALT
jgi:pimeloyl-ACP methyl ester carboxylesterase